MDIVTRFDWAVWWAGVTPEFVFLLMLPVVVAVAGLAVTRRKPRAD